MSFGTLDRTPPPFFRQGPSAFSKLLFCSALALLLMVADSRFQITRPLRAIVATALHPVELALLFPVRLWEGGADYFRGLRDAQTAEADARQMLTLQAERTALVEPLQAENTRLRALLALQPKLSVRHQAAEVLYEASDPYSRKVIVNRGQQHGVLEGSPVLNEQGILGQVTRVYPLSAEVTLLTDKDAAIPVLNRRTQQHGAAFGMASPLGTTGNLELRFMAGSADVQVGDLLTTSGADGIYPEGLPVASVASVERKAQTNFARIILSPIAASDHVRHVLLLEPLSGQMPTRPEAPPTAAAKKGVKK